MKEYFSVSYEHDASSLDWINSVSIWTRDTILYLYNFSAATHPQRQTAWAL